MNAVRYSLTPKIFPSLNQRQIVRYLSRSSGVAAALVLFPSCLLTGYDVELTRIQGSYDRLTAHQIEGYSSSVWKIVKPSYLDPFPPEHRKLPLSAQSHFTSICQHFSGTQRDKLHPKPEGSLQHDTDSLIADSPRIGPQKKTSYQQDAQAYPESATFEYFTAGTGMVEVQNFSLFDSPLKIGLRTITSLLCFIPDAEGSQGNSAKRSRTGPPNLLSHAYLTERFPSPECTEKCIQYPHVIVGDVKYTIGAQLDPQTQEWNDPCVLFGSHSKDPAKLDEFVDATLLAPYRVLADPASEAESPRAFEIRGHFERVQGFYRRMECVDDLRHNRKIFLNGEPSVITILNL